MKLSLGSVLATLSGVIRGGYTGRLKESSRIAMMCISDVHNAQEADEVVIVGDE